MDKPGQEPEISLSHFDEILDKSKDAKKVLTERLQIRVVTPMFGGGRKSGVVDEPNKADKSEHAIPVRESAIRGHLRFWWRATKGAVFGNVNDLRRREVAIFGDTRNPSRVKVWVETVEPPKTYPAMDYQKKKQKIDFDDKLAKYAVFPYRNIEDRKTGEVTKFRFLHDYTFNLHIVYQQDGSWRKSEDNEAITEPLNVEQLQKELHAALWAWINFGGLGSRTRRGCGSLYCAEFSPKASDAADLKQWFEKQLVENDLALPPRGTRRAWSTLCPEIYIKSAALETLDQAWKGAISVVHKFRSRSNTKSGEKKRSHWPEADSLRKMMDMAEPDHLDPTTLASGDLEYAFPRAQFGLPIIFEFRQDNRLKSKTDGKREPYKSQLVPKGKDRLASPLIIKALVIGHSKAIGEPKNVAGIGMLAILNQPELDEVELQIQEQGANKDSVETLLAQKRIGEQHIYPTLNYDKNPMQARNGKPIPSAIDAFLQSEEVKRWLKIKTDRG